ncbi:MAG: hypothetical protein L0323_21950 [Planctomycetes bacterium]|nr:hypothetical protein [Planctomycetota bacterium]
MSLLLVLLGLAGTLRTEEDVETWLRAFSSSHAAERRNAENRLREALRMEDLPLVEEVLRGGDAEARRRIARVLGTEPRLLGYLMKTYAAGKDPLAAVAEEAIRLALHGGTRPIEVPQDEARKTGLASVVLEADYAGEPVSRFLEDLNRHAAALEPVLLDPAVARDEPRLGADLRGPLPQLLQEIEHGTGLRWVAFPPRFSFLTRDPPSSGGGEVFLRLVRAFESGPPGERRIAAIGLALLGPPGVERVLAEEARSGGERGADALAGLCAPWGASRVLRSPDLIDRLVLSLEDSDAGLRRGAAHALFALAPSEPGVGSACLSRLAASSRGVRATLVRILGRCRGEGIAEAIQREVQASDPKVAAAAIEALTDAGSPPKSAAAAALLRRDRLPLLRAAERALRAASPSVEELAPLLGSTDPELRRVGKRLLPGSGAQGAARFWAACAEEADPFFLASLAEAARRQADLGGSGELASTLPASLAALPLSGRDRLRVFLVAASTGTEPFAPPPDLLLEAHRVLQDANDPLGDLAAEAVGRLEGRAAGADHAARRRTILGLVEAGKAAPPRILRRVLAALAAFLLAAPAGPTPGEIDEAAGGLKSEYPDVEAAEAALRTALVTAVRLRDRDLLSEALDGG